MSGFEIFGVVAAAGPILQSTIPIIVRTVETLRDSKVIKAKTAADITTLSHELRLWHQIYVRILEKRSPNMRRDTQLVTEFGSLFEDFPAVVFRITEESNRITEKSTLGFLIHRSKLEGMVLELEKHLQCVFRRISLLVVHLRDASCLPQHVIANDILARVNRSDRIRDLLMSQRDSQSEVDISIQDELDGEENIDGSECYVAQLRLSKVRVIVESRTYSRAPEELTTTKRTIQILRGVPSENWPILRCRGALRTFRMLAHTSIKVLYAFPAVSPSSGVPRSLWSVLSCDGLPAPANLSHYFQPLATRLALAKEVANAVLFVHIGGLVHKNIHPGTILLFPSSMHVPQGEDRSLGSAFLVGFTESRVDRDGYSSGPNLGHSRGVDEGYPQPWPTIIYEHPNREGPEHARYSMLHDIYALGVVLLEIGLWQLLVKRPDKLADPAPNPVLAPLWASNSEIPNARAKIKAALIDYAQATLPSFMGDLYTNVVLSCLTCMDGQADSVLGARFIEIVLDNLDRIQV
ncbi:hypothetical protein FRC06_005338 [Ceratobasidium sp. 370]|nr:hypothetical protein FRC06_005338 [Ceratobasidium sp. 370]